MHSTCRHQRQRGSERDGSGETDRGAHGAIERKVERDMQRKGAGNGVGGERPERPRETGTPRERQRDRETDRQRESQ